MFIGKSGILALVAAASLLAGGGASGQAAPGAGTDGQATASATAAIGTAVQADPAAAAQVEAAVLGNAKPETAAKAGAAVPLSPLRGLSDDTAAASVFGSLKAGDIVGWEIVQSEGRHIATVVDVLTDAEGQVRAVQASVGGILGFGASHIVLPIDKLRPAGGSVDALVSTMDDAELRAIADTAVSGARG